MNIHDIPVIQRCYNLYKLLHQWRSTIAKSDRHTLWLRIENSTLALIGLLLHASQSTEKRKALEQASIQLNTLRIFIRLAKDTKSIDLKKYVQLQQIIDEVGRMIGGWLKSLSS
jgi:hypothetical protein